jgi:hypothetical protein
MQFHIARIQCDLVDTTVVIASTIEHILVATSIQSLRHGPHAIPAAASGADISGCHPDVFPSYPDEMCPAVRKARVLDLEVQCRAISTMETKRDRAEVCRPDTGGKYPDERNPDERNPDDPCHKGPVFRSRQNQRPLLYRFARFTTSILARILFYLDDSDLAAMATAVYYDPGPCACLWAHMAPLVQHINVHASQLDKAHEPAIVATILDKTRHVLYVHHPEAIVGQLKPLICCFNSYMIYMKSMTTTLPSSEMNPTGQARLTTTMLLMFYLLTGQPWRIRPSRPPYNDEMI